MKYIENPNLPQSRVGAVAISCTAEKAIRSLNKIGIKTYIVKPDLRLPMPINAHADLQLLHIENDIMFTSGEHLCAGELVSNFKVRMISDLPGDSYPNDVRLNCAIIGDKIICNTKTTAKEILEYAEKCDYRIINTNQGYSKCSVCIVDENAIITDDKSIFTAAQKFFNDVLFVSKGSIRLNGYDYGFIGGCCGKIDKDKLAFNGAVESHYDYKLIIDFLSRNHVECVELSNDVLTDIGGILPLYEK